MDVHCLFPHHHRSANIQIKYMTEINPQEENIDLKEIIASFIGKWHYFLISAILCTALAFVYILVTPSTYLCEATLLINDNSQGNSMPGGNLESFADMGLFKANTDIKNEIHILQSPMLMENVVSQLKLNYNYNTKFKSIRRIDLYNATPVTVELDSAFLGQMVNFTIDLPSENTFVLSDFKIDKLKFDTKIQGKLSTPLLTPYGTMTIRPTQFHTDQTIGQSIFFSKKSIIQTAKACCTILNVNLSKDKASIIGLSYKDINPRRAEDILNTLISAYNENWIKNKNLIISSTSQFIDERLKVIETELGNVDEKISIYKSTNLLPDVKAVSNIYLTQSTATANQLANLQNQLAMALYIQTYMNGTASNTQLLPANSGIENTAIENQIDKYNTLQLQKNNLLANSSEQNPIVSDMISTLRSMREVIIRSIDDYIVTLHIQIENTLQEEKQTNQKIATNPNQAKTLLSIERQQKIKEELYLFLLQKREENELSQTFTAYNTRIVNRPTVDDSPIAPRKNILLLAALLLGLSLPAVGLFTIESWNTLVKNRKDLNILTIPFVGEIPISATKKKKYFNASKVKPDPVKLLIKEKNRDIINEAFRVVRTNIDFMRPKNEEGCIVMFTSFHPGSGKTFISSNLAVSMGIKGTKTIIIDADLRKATLSTLIDSPKIGLSDYLNGSIDNLKQLSVQGTIHPHVDVLPVGTIPPNPSELLLGERFSRLLAYLRTRYDYIFLDCPPVTIVTDSSIIGQHCDMTLFIIRAGLMDKRSLPELQQIYTSGQLKNMAVILNSVEYTAKTYGYRKYGYGYATKESDNT